MHLDPATVQRVVAAALREDLADTGDVTTDAVVAPELRSVGHFVARQDLVVAGLPLVRAVFEDVDPDLRFEPSLADGDAAVRGARVAAVRGSTGSILKGERTALNFMMRMSGIATATRAAVREIERTDARILDTRKTAPGLRELDKYAVAAGGGTNHRLGLFDAVMVKDTHLDAGVTIAEAVRRALERGHPAGRITVEVRDLDQLEQAIEAGAGRALLDNMSPPRLREAVARARGRIVLEASGGLRPGGLLAVASTGVDFLSLGWLTHSAPAADLAMEMEAAGRA